MAKLGTYIQQTITYQFVLMTLRHLREFFETFGDISYRFCQVVKYLVRFEINFKQVIEQSSRFAVDSLPITLSIVAMTSVIIASQVALEMVKQGGGNFIGMMMTILIVREIAVIMSGFAIISMIGSSLASEIATMRVTEQIDAIKVLKVDPIANLFIPRILSGIIMMPFVTILAAVIGVLAGAVTSDIFAGLSYRAYFDSAWLGIYMKDLWVSLLKAVCFGGTIALISCTCGYFATGGAKGVGLATTKAVVWSFVAIVIWDMVFAIAFFF